MRLQRFRYMFNFLKPRVPEIFFIRGYAKSGTNWLCNLMNLHPDVSCCGEFRFGPLFEGLRDMQEAETGILKKKIYQPLLIDRVHASIRQLIIDVCEGARLCGDRTPGGLRTAMIPGSKTLYISRDGRDAIVSWNYHSLNCGVEEGSELKRKELQLRDDPQYFENNKHELLPCEESVRSYARTWNRRICNDFSLMRAADRGDNQLEYQWLRYEDLHADTERMRNEAYRFLGLDPNKARPLTPQTEAGFGDPTTNRPTDFFRRGCVGTWREYFTEEQLEWFESEAREGLELVGAA